MKGGVCGRLAPSLAPPTRALTRTRLPPPPRAKQNTKQKGRVNLIGEHIDYEGYGVLPMAIRADTVVAIRVVPAASSTTTAGGAAPAPEPAAAESPTTLRLANLDSAAYPPAVFSADPDQPVDVANHSWGNYFLAAYKGVHDFLRGRAVAGAATAGASAGGAPPTTATVPTPLPSLEVLVHGTVPLGSGLSSSAALVCSASLAILAAYGKVPPPARGPFAWAAAAAAAAGLGGVGASRPVTKGEVADFSCKAERYVGVNGGGMDQAISVMARQGVAMLVDFDPVRASEVPLPRGALFVVGNSLAVSKKAETADKRYNLRVVECRLAAALLARRLGASAEEAAAVRTLRDVEERVAEHGKGVLEAEAKEAGERARREAEKSKGKKKEAVEAVVDAAAAAVDASTDTTDPVARASAAIATGISQERAARLEAGVRALLGGKKDGVSFGRGALEKELGLKLDDPRLFGDSAPSMRAIAAAGKDGFRLRDRALHVYGEAARVREFAAVARAAAAAADADAASSDAAPSSPVTPLTQDGALARLGALMDASHASCASLYDCSAPELDEFCAAARQSGALGARLTGAGWGGCAVALVREADAPAFLEAMRTRFYDKRVSKGLVKKEELGACLFATRPSSGAAVLRLDLFSSSSAAAGGSPSAGGAAATASPSGGGGGLAGSLRGLSLRRSGAGTAGGGGAAAATAVVEAP